MTDFTDSERDQLAPTGVLRAAINLGNAALAQRDEATGELGGVSVALARELGRQLDIAVDLVPYDGAGKVFADAENDVWDIAFLAIDEARAEKLVYTNPYVSLEGTYAVPASSSATSLEDVDQPRARIVIANNSAYDLFLSTALKGAEIDRAPTPAESLEVFDKGNFDAVAGVRQTLQRYFEGRDDIRILPGSFTEIRQAMAVPKPRTEAGQALSRFVEDVKRDGFVREKLSESGQQDMPVAPPMPIS